MHKLQYTKNEKCDEPRLSLAVSIINTTLKLPANFATSLFYPDAAFTPSFMLKNFQLHISSKDCISFVHPGFENTHSLIYLFLLQKEYILITENVESVKNVSRRKRKKNPFIIKSPGGSHCYKVCWVSNLCYYAFLTYMRNYCIYDFAEDTFLLN